MIEALGRPGLARLLAAARERCERLGRLGGRITLPGATPAERRAAADLLGLATLPAEPLKVDLRRLDRALRESRLRIGLLEALTILDGPLRDLPAERRQAQRRWDELWTAAAGHAAVGHLPALRRWLERLSEEGLLRRLARQEEPGALLTGALDVLAALERVPPPETGAGEPESVRLPVLASRVLGSSHALDAGRPVATLVLRALATLAGLPAPSSAAERRELWEWGGVVEDDLSCDVLAVGLAPESGGAVGEAMRRLAAAGEPARWTLRQLDAPGLSFPCDLEVRVCENPVVVGAAADRWGGACRPLVCVAGQPNQAARRLLGILARGGARLHYHGDFDWAGLRIAGLLRQALPIACWRFGARDYAAALSAGAEGPPLSGSPAESPWDPELAQAMAATGVAVEEEAVLDALVADLGP